MNQEISTQSTPSEVKYAGFWIRFAAYIIDIVILGVVTEVLSAVFGAIGVDSATKSGAITIQAISIVIGAGYFIYFHSSDKMATIGKQAMGIKVVNAETFARISQLNALGRYAAIFISSFTLCIGFIMAGFTKKNQALHDFMAGTVVIYK